MLYQKKYDQVFAGIEYHIGKIDGVDVNFNAGYEKIKFLTGDSLSLGKLIYFPTMTVIIRCVFKPNGIYYHQFFLDDCLYQIQKRFLMKELTVVKELILVKVVSQ